MTENSTKITKKNQLSRRLLSGVLFVLVAALLLSSLLALIFGSMVFRLNRRMGGGK